MAVNTNFKMLEDRIKGGDARICIIGLGYVGLPLVVEFVEAGYTVTGVDLSKSKVESLKKGRSYIEDVPSSQVKKIIRSGKFLPGTEYRVVKNQDAVIICVPTPLRKTREPDLSYIAKSVEEISRYITKGTLVILESTSYPGTTREMLLPKFEEKGLKGGKDVFIAFSPERVDPGNKDFGIKNTPKVVGGIDKRSLDLACLLYGQIVDNVIDVYSCEEAEMVKLLENTFRAVNIGLINELAKLCSRFDIDIWNVIRAASTKPYGFMPFYPGPGLGGHCIPIDPQFLSWKAKSNMFYPRFIDLAEEVNRSMPEYAIRKIADILNNSRKSIKGSKILIMGVSYKKNVGDTRESPAYDIIDLLKRDGANLSFADPYVKSFAEVKRVPLPKVRYSDYDCVVIVTDHDDFDFYEVTRISKALLDCRGVTLGMRKQKKIVRI